MIDSYFDVLIIGSGLSGINAAYRIQESLPDVKFTILEARHELGGTWSQFKYPGVRSDSDLHTLGFQFNPWRSKNPIASGESIMTYLKETAHKFDIDKKIRYRHRVLAADWRSEEQRWRVDVEIGNDVGREPRRVVYWTKWLITGTGYYSYDEPLKANIPGIDNFQGQRIHPQFWPEDLDYRGKKVVIVGSGATTITLLPAMVDGGAASVTQLQRSPSYIMSIPKTMKHGLRNGPRNGLLSATSVRQLPFLITWTCTDLSRLYVHSHPILALQVLRLVPHPCLIVSRQQSCRSAPARLPSRPALQAWVQPLATTYVSLS